MKISEVEIYYGLLLLLLLFGLVGIIFEWLRNLLILDSKIYFNY